MRNHVMIIDLALINTVKCMIHQFQNFLMLECVAKEALLRLSSLDQRSTFMVIPSQRRYLSPSKQKE